MSKKLLAILLALGLVLSLAGCGLITSGSQTTSQQDAVSADAASAAAQTSGQSGSQSVSQSAAEGSALDTAELFTDRDLAQTADLSEAVPYTLTDGQTVTVTAAGVYVLKGSAKNASVVVEAGDDDKVQLVLDGLSLTNDSTPCIYVKNADKVFVTTAENSENSLSVTGTFTADGTANTDAVIFSRDDLILNGLGKLTVISTDNGISGKDDVKITGGELSISCVSDGIEANDSIRICGGTITVTANKDGLHAENDEDNSVGYIYLSGGTLDVRAGDDGLHATTILQIDGGVLTVTAAEGLEGTWVQINGGTVTLSASDDGINAARKSGIRTPAVEINGGTLTITMGRGDTDGIDSNGDLIITGGTVDITGQSPFDYDGTLTHTGGTLIVNGVETDTVTNQFGGQGGFPGQGGPGGQGGGRRH